MASFSLSTASAVRMVKPRTNASPRPLAVDRRVTCGAKWVTTQLALGLQFAAQRSEIPQHPSTQTKDKLTVVAVGTVPASDSCRFLVSALGFEPNLQGGESVPAPQQHARHAWTHTLPRRAGAEGERTRAGIGPSRRCRCSRSDNQPAERTRNVDCGSRKLGLVDLVARLAGVVSTSKNGSSLSNLGLRTDG
ncbi:hypothetical protein VUR80DRAFT_8751 [Thermomyces stellatus]